MMSGEKKKISIQFKTKSSYKYLCADYYTAYPGDGRDNPPYSSYVENIHISNGTKRDKEASELLDGLFTVENMDKLWEEVSERLLEHGDKLYS